MKVSIGDRIAVGDTHGHIVQIRRGFYIVKTTTGYMALREVTKEAPP